MAFAAPTIRPSGIVVGVSGFAGSRELERGAFQCSAMASAAPAIRPSGIIGVPSCSGSREMERGALLWSFLGTGRFVSLPQRRSYSCRNLSWRDGQLVSGSGARVCKNLGFSTFLGRRRKQGFSNQAGSCFCIYYVAQSQVPETESRKVRKEPVKRGRKTRIQSDDEAESSVSPSNGFSHEEQSVDDRGETPEMPEIAENVVEKKKTRKKQSTIESGQTVGSTTTTAPRKAGKKKVNSLETTEERDSSSNASEIDRGNSLGSNNYGSSAETKDEPALALGRGNYNGETSEVSGHSDGAEIVAGHETDHRLLFLESLMERARSGDVEGVEEALSEMDIAGIKAGPRAYHGLVVSYTRARDVDGAIEALRRELAAVERPLPETFVAMARLFGSLGQAHHGEEILAVMEKLKHNPRVAWMILIEELQKSGHLQEADVVFFKGAKGGIRATPELYSILIEENAKVGDHGNAINVMRSLEYAGFQPTTFHYNCLLMCQANANVPEVAASTFEDMQYGPDEMKPDTESYNWLLQAHIRHNRGDRCPEVVDVIGEMVEDHKRVQPNMRTYCLLIECFTKYSVANEAVRYFRALSRLPGGMRYLHDDGKNGDTLSLYLRALCLEGRAADLLEALEAMVADKQDIAPRAMFVSSKGRTLVSSWIEPIGAEADLGYEVDYISRYMAEGGAAGTRKRWSDLESGSEDSQGFVYSAPIEMSFKQQCAQLHRRYILRLMRKLRDEGVLALGPGATDEDVVRVMAKLRKETIGEMVFQPKKPKAASNMLVNELREELAGQGLPTDGTRPVLYQRVQKARRINRARGRPLWVPEPEEEMEEDTEEDNVDIFLRRLTLENDHTEFWRKRLTGEIQDADLFQVADGLGSADLTEDVDSDFGEEDEDDIDEDAEEIEENEDLAEDGGADDPEAPELLALKLMKKKAEVAEQQVLGNGEAKEGSLLGLTLQQKIAKIRNEKLLDPSDMYTIADVWGWTWEREIRAKEPTRWSQEYEVQIGMQIMQRVLDLGGVPTIGDCAMLVHAAMRIPWPEAIVSLVQQTHKFGYKFGSKLYNDIVKLFIHVGEKDAAIAVMADMEEVGISAPGDLINTVLVESVEVERQEIS
ncbi:unnamed protein product [Calypogeia fissa]